MTADQASLFDEPTLFDDAATDHARSARHDDIVDDHFDLVILGSGSGNSLINDDFAGLRIALVDRGTFGGTCLNYGCIPTKMFVVPADLAASPLESSRLGVDLKLTGTHFEQIRDRIFGRVDAISSGGLDWRRSSDNVTVFQGTARFDDPHTLSVDLNDGGTTRITADRVVLAVGSRPSFPDLPGLDDPAVQARTHTSETVMRLPELPRRMVIIGGGFIAAEFAHVFAALGTKVTVINRSRLMLRKSDTDIAEHFTAELSQRVSLRLGMQLVSVEGDERTVTVVCRDENGVEYDFEAEVLLVAAGRVPNADTLNAGAAGVEVDDRGFVTVDEHQRTTAAHVWALGDVCSPAMLKHVANAEMRAVQHNLLHPEDLRSAPHHAIPHAVFSHPQVAAVGLTEQELVDAGRRHVRVVQKYADVAYGWALEDQGHFVKLLGDPESGELLGAHIIGPDASVLIQPLVHAMATGVDFRGLAGSQYWIHPALTEVVENALIALEHAADEASGDTASGPGTSAPTDDSVDTGPVEA